jgi:hypothetical protein
LISRSTAPRSPQPTATRSGSTTKARIDADDLAPGDLLVLADGTTVDVDAVVERAAVLTFYNLTVDGIHTYHVMAGDAPPRGTHPHVHRARWQELARDAVYKLLAYDHYAELMEKAIRAAGPLLEQYIAGNNEKE